MMKTLILFVGISMSAGLMAWMNNSAVSNLEYSELTGSWMLHSAYLENCDFADNVSFTGVNNNCYEFGGFYKCRITSWIFDQDSTFAMTIDDYYPDHDTTIVNANVLNGVIRNANGNIEFCNDEMLECRAITLNMLGDTLVMENLFECDHQFKLIRT